MKRLRVMPLLLLSLSACGPSVIDGTYPIKGGYLFYETGGNGKTIEYEEPHGEMRNIVPQRVDAYVEAGRKIIVARRPAEPVTRNGIADWKLLPTCEYWMIDTQTHAVEQIADANKWPSVRCN